MRFSEHDFSAALAEAPTDFQYDSLKPEQWECLRRVICLDDVLAVLPTGFGKIFNLPNNSNGVGTLETWKQRHQLRQLWHYFYREIEVKTQICWHLSKHLNSKNRRVLRIRRGTDWYVKLKYCKDTKCVYFGQKSFCIITVIELIKFPANMCS